jgi:hypothetical protein
VSPFCNTPPANPAAYVSTRDGSSLQDVRTWGATTHTLAWRACPDSVCINSWLSSSLSGTSAAHRPQMLGGGLRARGVAVASSCCPPPHTPKPVSRRHPTVAAISPSLCLSQHVWWLQCRYLCMRQLVIVPFVARYPLPAPQRALAALVLSWWIWNGCGVGRIVCEVHHIHYLPLRAAASTPPLPSVRNPRRNPTHVCVLSRGSIAAR